MDQAFATQQTESGMQLKQVTGVHAALLTPRQAGDDIDVDALTRLINFLSSQGISSFAVNGATGEFCLTKSDHLRKLLRVVREASLGKASILCGVGAPGVAQSVEFAAVAKDEGAKGLLLPMPSFFPYEQEDLELFSREVAGSTDLPILLYNLPQFTSGLTKETVRTLIMDVPNIVGIKDSSGSLEILRDLTLNGVEACRIVGNDSVLPQALIEGVCDGVISGVATALPEIVLALYQDRDRANSKEFLQAARLLGELIEQLSVFPTPWGLKWIAEARGVLRATFSQPVTVHRIAQKDEMISWFGDWRSTTDVAGAFRLDNLPAEDFAAQPMQ
jgi:4-hydroxy-tetrahydrodipicolinate synthase